MEHKSRSRSGPAKLSAMCSSTHFHGYGRDKQTPGRFVVHPGVELTRVTSMLHCVLIFEDYRACPSPLLLLVCRFDFSSSPIGAIQIRFVQVSRHHRHVKYLFGAAPPLRD